MLNYKWVSGFFKIVPKTGNLSDIFKGLKIHVNKYLIMVNFFIKLIRFWLILVYFELVFLNFTYFTIELTLWTDCFDFVVWEISVQKIRSWLEDETRDSCDSVVLDFEMFKILQIFCQLLFHGFDHIIVQFKSSDVSISLEDTDFTQCTDLIEGKIDIFEFAWSLEDT